MGFLVLLLSPVPMVRSFGALLVLGIGLALVCALVRRLRRAGSLPRRAAPGGRAARTPAALAALGRHPRVAGAREWLADRSWRALGLALSRPRRVLAVGLAVAVVGLALDTQSEVVSDVRELVPQDLQALKDVEVLQEETGVSGEIDVTVRADDITDPAVVSWMTRFQEGVLRAHGYRSASAARRSATRPSCARRCRCPTCSAARRAPPPARASCWTPCRPTSPRAWSRPTARRPTSPSASG